MLQFKEKSPGLQQGADLGLDSGSTFYWWLMTSYWSILNLWSVTCQVGIIVVTMQIAEK